MREAMKKWINIAADNNVHNFRVSVSGFDELPCYDENDNDIRNDLIESHLSPYRVRSVLAR